MTVAKTLREALEILSPDEKANNYQTALHGVKNYIAARDKRFEGKLSKCKAEECGSIIYWVRTAAGKAAPIDVDGEPHFATCPAAESFRLAQSKREGNN